MKQKAIRKIFAILALIAIFVSLLGVGLVYIFGPKTSIKETTKQKDEVSKLQEKLDFSKIKIETKDGAGKIKVGDIKKQQNTTK